MNLSDEKFTELTKLKELDLMEQAKLDITIMMTCSRAKFANSLEKNLEIYNEFDDLRSEYVKKYCRFFNNTSSVMKSYQTIIDDAILRFLPDWYKIPVIMSEDEMINGYKLYDLDESNGKFLFRYDYFLKLVELFNEPNIMSEKEFMIKFDEEACTDWSKQDQNGECFGGFWKYPEDSDEKKNAWQYTRDANCKSLYNLPYSHELIFETIKYGCNTRMESVRFSNFMCEYIKRKLNNKPKLVDAL